MSATRAGLKRRLALLEKRTRCQTALGLVVYNEIATGGTLVTTKDGRRFYGAQAEALIAAEIEAGRYDPVGEGGITALNGICLDIVLGRVKYPGGPYDDLMRARGVREGLEETELQLGSSLISPEQSV